MIPKKIHFVWVGNKPKPNLVLQCIDSWKRLLPDYEIIEWNNESLISIQNDYVLEAFKMEKWAFVSDYLRLHALYHHGGIYLDSDVEITQSLNSFLHNDFFTGYEDCEGICHPITAVMGAIKNSPLIAQLLNTYTNRRFILNDGTLDLTTNTQEISEYFESKYNLKKDNGKYNGNITSPLGNNMFIYPSYYFCTPRSNLPNYAIHHFSGSWGDGYNRRDKLSLLNWSLVRFKRKEKRAIEENYTEKENLFPLNYLEKIIFKIKLSKKTFYAITKKKRKIHD